VCRECGGAAQRLGGTARAALQRAAGPDWSSASTRAWSGRELASAREALRLFVEHRIGHRLRAQGLASAERETA